MRTIALAALALALSACGGGDSKTDEANALNDDNMLMDENMLLDSNGAGGLDSNASTNSGTENMMLEDAATNDPDTNLANGL
jgi:hypothetical protein